MHVNTWKKVPKATDKLDSMLETYVVDSGTHLLVVAKCECETDKFKTIHHNDYDE